MVVNKSFGSYFIIFVCIETKSNRSVLIASPGNGGGGGERGRVIERKFINSNNK